MSILTYRVFGKGPTIVAAFAGAALLGMACTSGTSKNAATQTPTAVQTATSAATATRPAAGTATTMSPAADLRVALDTLLSEHAELAQLAMQKGYDGAPDFQATADELDKNSVGLSKAIGSVYGSSAEESFLALWRQHIGFFVDYTKAVKANDPAAKSKADQSLQGYVGNAATFFASANPNLSKDAVATILKGHVSELEASLDKYAVKDYATTYSTQVMAIDHMFMTGGTLAGAIAKQFPDKIQGQSANQAVDLRVGLDQLLSVHAYLAQLAMQKGYDGAPDFQATADELDKNSVGLSKAIGSVYGSDAETSFLALWRQHIGFFVDYTKASKTNDAAAKSKADQNLQGYVGNSAAFFAGANPNLPKDAVATTLKAHVSQLEDSLTSYAGKDYTKTYATRVEATNHMFMTGDTIAAAIVKQSPDKFAK